MVRQSVTVPSGMRIEEYFDLVKKVQVARQVWSSDGALVQDETWTQRHWRSQRWLIARRIRDLANGRLIRESYDWEWPDLGVAKGRLRRAP